MSASPPHVTSQVSDSSALPPVRIVSSHARWAAEPVDDSDSDLTRYAVTVAEFPDDDEPSCDTLEPRTVATATLTVLEQAHILDLFTVIDGESGEIGALATPFITGTIAHLADHSPPVWRIVAIETLNVDAASSDPGYLRILAALDPLRRLAGRSDIVLAHMEDFEAGDQGQRLTGELVAGEFGDYEFVYLGHGVIGARLQPSAASTDGI